MILRLGNFFSKLTTFSAYSYFISSTIFCFVRKFMSSDTNFFSIVFCRRAITESCRIFSNRNHSQMLWIPTIDCLTNMIDAFTFLKLSMQDHRKLMSASVASLVTNPTIARLVSCAFPQPARICNTRFLFKLIQIKNIISWRFKNTFHLSPSTSI